MLVVIVTTCLIARPPGLLNIGVTQGSRPEALDCRVLIPPETWNGLTPV